MARKELAQLFVTLGFDDKEFVKGMNKFQKTIKTHSKEMAVAGAAIVGAIAAIGTASIKMAADFDAAMREVNTMMQLGEDEFRAFSDEVREMSAAMGVDAVESAKALYQAISAGVPKENAIDFMTVATKAAIGGVSDLTTAVDGLTTVINAFGLSFKDAEHVADIMFTTVKGGKTTLTELADSLFNVAPVASAMGVSLEEVSAALAAMTQQGVPTTQATTQLRQVILALSAPTDEAKKKMGEMGIEMTAAHLESVGLAGAMQELLDATEGDASALRKLVGSTEAVQAVLQLTGENADKFSQQLDNMQNSAGAAEDAFQQMEKSVSRQWEKLTSSIKEVAMSIGDALIPILISVIDFIRPVITAIGNWIKENPELVRNITLVAGAIGSFLLGLGLLGMAIPMIVRGLTGLITAFRAVSVAAATAWASILGPVAAIIAAVAAVGTAIYFLVRAFTDSWSWTEILFEKWAQGIRENADQMAQDARTAFGAWSENAQSALSSVTRVIDKMRAVETAAHNDRMNEIEDERLARIAAVDEAAAAQIAALNKERDDIYDEIDARREARIREQEDARTLELQNLIAAAQDAERRAELEEQLADHLISVQNRRWEEEQRDRAEAIADEITAVQNKADFEKQIAENIAAAQKANSELALNNSLANIDQMEEAENQRYQDELTRYQDELDAFIAMNDGKLENTLEFVRAYNKLMEQLGGGKVEIPAGIFPSTSGWVDQNGNPVPPPAGWVKPTSTGITQTPEGNWVNEQGLLVPPPSFQGWEGIIPGPVGKAYPAIVHGGEIISQPGGHGMGQSAIDSMVASAISRGLAGMRINVNVGGKEVVAVVSRGQYQQWQDEV